MTSLPPFREKSLPRGLSHRATLILPGSLALLGCTYPRAMLGFGASAGLLVAAQAVLRARSGRQTLQERRSDDDSGSAMTVLLSALCLLVGIFRGFYWEARVQAAETLSGLERPIEVTVVPLDYPRYTGLGLKGSFRALVWSQEVDQVGCFGVQATAFPRDVPEFTPGTAVRCIAAFEAPLPAMNPGGFDYRGYLLGKRLFSLVDIQSVAARGNLGSEADLALSLLSRTAMRAAASAKAHMERAVDSTFPSEDAAVLKGVFLGNRGDLSQEDSLDFKRSGFYRFIAICGFHVELLATLVEAVMRRLTKRPSLARIAAISAAFCYASLSGWTAGVIRAFVSGFMRMLAPPLRRKYHPLAGLGASAVAVALFIPVPLSNTGLLLSFAGAGGAWLGGVYAEVVSSLTFHLKASRLVAPFVRAATMSLVLFPVMAFSFTEVSIASFMLSGVWGTVAGLMIPLAALMAFVPWIGAVLGWAPYMLLAGIRAVSRVFSALPVAGLVVPSPSVVEVGAYWALLLVPLLSPMVGGGSRAGEDAVAYFGRQRFLAALCRCLIFCAPVVLLMSAAQRVIAPWPEVTFLYVGQGDCAVIRRGTSVMMVDTGTAAAFESHVLPYLKAKGVTHVDLCVISHLHADHAGGLRRLCSEMPVGCVAVPPGYAGQAKDLVTQGGFLPERAIPEVVELLPGHEYAWARAPMSVVLPQGGRPGAGPEEVLSRDHGDDPGNDSSLAFVLDLGGLAVEFWGDSPSSSVSQAFRGHLLSMPETARIVKVPHHGSADAYEPRLYDRFGGDFPSYAVISVGPNSYGPGRCLHR